MADTTTKRVLYVGTYTQKLSFVDGKGKGIYSFEFDLTTGALRPLAVTENIGLNPAYLTGTARTIYAIKETDAPQESDATKTTGYVQALAIDGASGALRPLNEYETKGSFPCHVSLSPEHDAITVANYGGGSFAVFPLQSDGSLAAMSDFQAFTGASMAVPDRQEAPHAHSVTWIKRANGDAHRVIVADLGTDLVHQFTWNKDSKTTGAQRHAARPAGHGPRHIAIHDALQVAYVLDELSSTIGVHPIDAASGLLSEMAIQNISTLPVGFTGTTLSADIHVSTCGRYLYASNRGHDSIACYRVNHDDRGTLELIGFEPTRGRSPRNFLIFGEYLLAANQDTDTIEVFQVESTTGRLVFTGQNVACPTPVSLFIAPLA